METEYNIFEQRLRDKLSRFFACGTLDRLPPNVANVRRSISEVLARLVQSSVEGYFFGGFLRDLLTKSPGFLPRDVDIVVADCSISELEEIFRDIPSRRTRFDGLRLEREITFDIWSLTETWAMKTLGVDATFTELPKTTFLTVEAVVANICAHPGVKRSILSHGFFEAIADQRIDINLEENPFPSLCVVRALGAASELNFSLSKRLAGYILDHSHVFSIESLLDIQRSHYGSVKYDGYVLQSWIRSIGAQLEHGRRRIDLPTPDQEVLWPDVVGKSPHHSRKVARRTRAASEMDSEQEDLPLGPAK